MKEALDNSGDHPPSPDEIGSFDSLDYENDEIDNDNDEIDEEGSIEENSEVLQMEVNNDGNFGEEIVAEVQEIEDGDGPEDEVNIDVENVDEGSDPEENEEPIEDESGESEVDEDQDDEDLSDGLGDEESSENDSSMEDRSYSSTDDDCDELMTEESEQEESEQEETEEENDEETGEEEEEEEMEEGESADELVSRHNREGFTGGSVQNVMQFNSPMNDEYQPSCSRDFQAKEARKDKKKKEKSNKGPQGVSAFPRWNHNNIFDWPDELQEEFFDISGMTPAERRVFYEMKMKMKKVRRELKKIRRIHKMKRRLKWLKKQEKKLRKERMKRILLEMYRPLLVKEADHQEMPTQDGGENSGEVPRKKNKSQRFWSEVEEEVGEDGMRNFLLTNEIQPSLINTATGALEGEQERVGAAQIYHGYFSDEDYEMQEHILIPTGNASTHVITMGGRFSHACTSDDSNGRMYQHVLYNPGTSVDDYVGPIIDNPYCTARE